MVKGTVTPAEWKIYYDRITGLPIRQLTDYKAHSHHLYFTENGWYDKGKRLLFFSDRGNSTNLFSVLMDNGQITQLTDYKNNDQLEACLHPEGTHAYLRRGKAVISLDLNSLEEQLLYECPDDYNIGNLSCTADGLSVLTCIQEDLSHRLDLDLGNGYVGHRELMEAAPSSIIISIDLVSGLTKEVYQSDCFITHVNASPTMPWLMTFCHEGPWHLVDHRIWGLNLKTGKVWKIRERFAPGEMVGHEFFFPEGDRIGYHGFRPDGTNFFGAINYDNSDLEETEFHFDTWHAHADGLSQAVADGKGNVKTLNLWRRMADGQFDVPRILCELRCSFHSQKVHAHPRFIGSGEQMVFTSDRTGYANVYLIDLPQDTSTLPMVESSK
ncbi:oligogalacturonate lyase family protein [Paenibacillus sp. Marseille-Q7038]